MASIKDSVVMFSEFDVAYLTLGPLETRKSREGADIKSCPLRYNGKPLFLQTPSRMRTPFGASAFEKGSGKSWSVSLDMDRDTADGVAFERVISSIDQKVAQECHLRSKEFFGKEKSLAAVSEGIYTPMVKVPTNEKYSNSLRFKLKQNGSGAIITHIFTGNSSHDKVDVDMIQRNSRLCAILELSGIYFAGNSCGVIVKAIQVLLEDSPPTFDEFAFKNIRPPQTLEDDADEIVD